MDTWLTSMQVAALAVAGMCHALLGSIKVPLAKKLNIDEARVGGLVSVFGFTLIPMVLVFGFLVDAVGKQAVLGGGFMLLIVAMVLLARLKSYPLALIAVLLLGTGWSALVNVLNVTSPPAFLPPDEIKSRMSYAMNMGDFVFGMGAFLTPILAAVLIRKLNLSSTLLILAAFAIVPVLLGLGVTWNADVLNPKNSGTVAGGLAELLTNPIVWLCCLAFFCHVPVEAAVATWATTLMTNKGVKEGAASTLLSVFWLTFMGSRLLAALTLPKGWDTTLVICMAVLCIAFTLGIALSRHAWLTCSMVILAGCILGPIFPTLIAILLSHLPGELHGRAVGIFFCIGGIGWTAIPILIGAYAKRTSVQQAFLIATGSAVLLTLLCVLLKISLSAIDAGASTAILPGQ
ncbi:MAG: MFS transporter [Pirellulaceae bacterium]